MRKRVQVGSVVPALVLGVGLAFGPQPAWSGVVTSMFEGDATFLELCGDGEACRIGVGELRLGNKAANGDWEVGVGEDTQDSAKFSQTNKVWPGEGATTEFKLSHTTASPGSLSLSVAGATDDPISFDVDLAGAQSLFIRARGQTERSTSLTMLELDSHLIPDLVTEDVKYIVVSGIDFTTDWTLTGKVAFNFADGDDASSLAAQFKITDIPHQVPEPTALALVGAGLTGLGMGKRWRIRG